MKLIEQVAAAIQDVLGRIAYELGPATGFVHRDSKLNGSRFVQTLVLTYLANPNASLTALAQTAAAVDLELTPAGLTQRFTPAAATLLQQVLGVGIQRVLAADPLAIPLLERFTGVYLEDSTTIALPAALSEVWTGCGNATGQGRAALKLSLRLDLCTGRLASLTLHDGRLHDRAAAVPLAAIPPGALYRADLSYVGLHRLQALGQQGTYFCSRLKASTQVCGPDGQRWTDLQAHRARHGTQVDLPVTLGATERLPCAS